MKISLIICTYMRPASLNNLLHSIAEQTRIPDEIIIVDGSTDELTTKMLKTEKFNLPLRYYKVDATQRGLTKQRNYGVEKVSNDMDIVAFLDDDTILDKNYFKIIIETYAIKKDAVGIGGISTNETLWMRSSQNIGDTLSIFEFDGWYRREDIRYRIRKRLNLVSHYPPGITISFGHERSNGFLPPTGKIYLVNSLIGMNMTYRKHIFEKIKFSTFFSGYGLYEDKDFSLRAGKYGNLYINTNAKVEHHHDPLGRPNFIKYGKMVVWNGWRVWRVATPNPALGDRIKWWSITILLAYIRLGNAIVGPHRRDALNDFIGRHISMFRLLFSKPPLELE